MKKTITFLAVAFIAAAITLPAFADSYYDYDSTDLTKYETVSEDAKQHSKYSFPSKKEVFIVGRITVKSDEDMSFFAKTRAVLEENLTKKNSFVIPMYYDSSEVDKDWAKSQRQLYEDGEFFFVKYDMPKDRIMRFGSISYYYFSDAKTMLRLPLDFSFEVPKDVNYVYIGSFTYTITGDDFTIKNVAVKDEYDEAQEAFNKIAGKKNAKLSRVTLKDYDAKKKK